MASSSASSSSSSSLSSSFSSSSSVLELAHEWVALDGNESSRSHVQALIDKNDIEQLTALFVPRIAFGTAGLRARMAPGYHNINELVVIQTSQGLCEYLSSCFSSVDRSPSSHRIGLIIGYDGRFNSRRFAELIAQVFLSRGFVVYLFGKIVCTPFVPFGILHYKKKLSTALSGSSSCSSSLNEVVGGVMVTASHNPKEDNGYKVYGANGAQIIPPHDANIAECIQRNKKPWHNFQAVSFDAFLKQQQEYSERLIDPFDEVHDSYFSAARQLSFTSSVNSSTPLRAVFTAMHGVGTPFTAHALSVFSLPPFIPTLSQVEIDPTFPTVPFPNPEEKGALNEALHTADHNSIDIEHANLILANDPDADRLAIAERDPVSRKWHIFNGNQIAILFADWIFTRTRSSQPSLSPSNMCMVNSIVSSAIVKALCKKEGIQHFETLTGFKWMGNKAAELEQASTSSSSSSSSSSSPLLFLFAFEVEIGFAVGNMSYDKDGVRTAAVFYEMAANLHAQQKTCVQHLQSLYSTYGFFHMITGYFFVKEAAIFEAIFTRIRKMSADGSTYPSSVGGFNVTHVRDISLGYDSHGPATLPATPDAYMIIFTLAQGGTTVTLRNSGTEPKLKFYVESSAASERDARQICHDVTEQLLAELVQPQKHGLTRIILTGAESD